MPKIDIAKMPVDSGSFYPTPSFRHDASRAAAASGSATPSASRSSASTSARIKPGAASSQRHWHEKEDEFVYVLEGELVLIEDDGETVLKPGDAAGLKAGSRQRHNA